MRNNRESQSGISGERGSLLFLAMLIMFAITTIALGAAGIITAGIRMGGVQARSTQAYAAAEAGAEMIMYEVRMKGYDFSGCVSGQYVGSSTAVCGAVGLPCCDNNPIVHILPANQAAYTIQYLVDGPDTVLKCYGDYRSTKREVELRY